MCIWMRGSIVPAFALALLTGCGSQEGPAPGDTQTTASTNDMRVGECCSAISRSASLKKGRRTKEEIDTDKTGPNSQ